ncbi:hypothetical protein [Paenibacillus sp. 481]|nr:hypothetical protein [Paenibacillus sp. 481]UHA74391.1 hypothetical protein KIK04_04575 [Paenibacillus sp. 481]
MSDKFKKNKGNKYAHNNEFAQEVLMKNVKHAAQKSPWTDEKSGNMHGK